MIHIEPLLYCFQVVIATARYLSPLQQTVDQFFLLHFKPQDNIYLGIAFGKHPSQGLGLSDSPRETVEYNPFLGFLMRIEHMRQNIHHQLVRNQLPLRNIRIGGFSQFSTPGYLFTQYISRRNMKQPIFFDDSLALSSLSRTRSAKNNYIQHFTLY